MYEHLWLIFVAAIPPTIAGFWAVYSSRKNTGKIQDVHLALNSRLDQLIDAVRTLAVADLERTFIDAVTDGVTDSICFAQQAGRCNIDPDGKRNERRGRHKPAR